MAYRKNILLQVGPVALLVNVESAVDSDSSTGLKTVCVGLTAAEHAPTPVKRTMACASCGNEDASSHKRARVEGSEYIVVDQEEVAGVRAEVIKATKEVISLTPHPVEPLRGAIIQGSQSTYYLTPSKPSLLTSYAVVVDMMRRHPEYGWLAEWTPMSRPALYSFRLYGDTIVMEPQARPEQLQIVQQASVEIPEANQVQIDMLLDTMVTDFDAETYADSYRVGIETLLASKEAQDGVVLDKATKATVTALPTATLDLTAMLGAHLASVAPAPKASKKKAA